MDRLDRWSNKQHADVSVELRGDRGELYLVDTYSHDDDTVGKAVRITSMGYHRLNAKAGLEILTPPDIRYENTTRPNPYILRDDSHKVVEVIARKIALGFAPNGGLVAADQTVSFRPINKLISDLLPIIHRYPAVGEICNKSSIGREELKKGWFEPLHDSGSSSIGIWVPNVKHQELHSLWHEYGKSISYAERYAQTMCERNAIKKHPAISFSTLAVHRGNDGVLSMRIPVRIWKYGGDIQEQLTKIGSQLRLDKPIEDVNIERYEGSGDEDIPHVEPKKETEETDDDQ